MGPGSVGGDVMTAVITPLRAVDRQAPIRVAAAVMDLSTRERHILGLMADGLSNSAICEELWLSPKTVESHVRSIFQKLGLRADGANDRRVVAVVAYLQAQNLVDAA